ncbi:soluble lytic murein transglycosylase-like protein [Bradymonas sediminis]|uniref:Uncharacterized protein n=1 Tax=Bradymonas sediminis TaxID=1548548 RepID=A0A2Z4FQJ5_9DELT|nr:hypothetical protein DN745_16925 [Bradymonas sediminis]TDP75349.1 soluble lytic murein transglycosylase-like protein [Bradymonas sediminis]
MRILGNDMKKTVNPLSNQRVRRQNRHAIISLSVLILLSFCASTSAAQTVPKTLNVEVEAEDAASDLSAEEALDRVLPSAERLLGEETDAVAESASANDEVEAAEIASDIAAEPDENAWRVPKSSKPPIQVRRAVGQIRASALQVAGEIATEESPEKASLASGASEDVGAAREEVSALGHTSGGALPSADDLLSGQGDAASAQDAAPVARAVVEYDAAPEETVEEGRVNRRVLDRFNPFDALGETVDFSIINEFAGKLLRNDSPTLVLSPYIKDPRWLEAMRLLKADECNEAYKLANEVVGTPDADTEPAIRYAVARIEMCTSAHAARGKKTLTELAHADQGVVARLARIRLGLPEGHDGYEEDESEHLYQRIRGAKKVAADGKVADAINDLETLLAQQTSGWYKYQIRSAHVEILEKAKRYDEAAAMMLEIYRDTRSWNIGDQVEARLARLDKLASKKVFDFGERVDRMRELIQRGKFKTAREVSVENAKLRGVSGSEIKGWGLYRQAMQAEQQRKREHAAELYAQAEKLVKDPMVRPRMYFGWAKALRRLDRDPEAIALYERVCSEYPGHTLCDQSLFEAGRLSQYLGLHEQARERFARMLENYPESKMVPKALWGSAFSAYLMEDFAAMEAPLRRLIAEYPQVKDASELTMGLKAQYWLGVALLKGGDLQAAQVALQTTINRGPLTWYGRLAVARMKSAQMKPVVHIPRSQMTQADLQDLTRVRVPDDARLHIAAEYSRLGLYADAISSIRDQASIYPKPQRVHEFLAAVYLANGDASNAHWIMKNHIDQSLITHQNLRDWGVAFPLNYMDLSHQYGTQYEVSPFLVQAIIRQESGFREGVSSYAGAMGLMQLMPGTARYTQRTFLDTSGRLSRAKMVEPETNVRLGTMYIRVQTAFASDRIALALAGYNAGPAPLKDWFERFGDRELDAWVESITYREARGYVRKVFTSYVTYAGLYGDGPLPEVNLTLPEKLRDWGDVPEVENVEPDTPISLLQRTP